jgi:hypothetical protein
MDIELQARLLKLKGILNNISHISFSYSRLEKQNPMHSLNDENAEKLIVAYKDLIDQVKSLTMNNEIPTDRH